MTLPPVLHLHTLGRFDLLNQTEASSAPLAKPPTIKSQSLLAYLAVHRKRPQPREKLMEMFWGDRPQQRARRSLSTALWQIRRCFPDQDPLQGDAFQVQFQYPGEISLDVELFESLALQTDPAALQSAVDLYRGEFLPGFVDEWVIDERYRLQSLLEEVLTHLMTRCETDGKLSAAQQTAHRLLAADNLREDAHRVLMRVYNHGGKRNLALKQYQLCREVTLRELGIEPMPETEELYQAILAGRMAESHSEDRLEESPELETHPPLAPQNPFDVTLKEMLVGRSVELERLQGYWQNALSGSIQLVLINGEAGVGKTQLVKEFGARIRQGGIAVLWGHCYEFEGLLPYQPLAEALKPTLLAMSFPDIQRLPDWVSSSLARIVPELIGRHPAALLKNHSGTRKPSPAEPGQEQTQLFHAVTQYLILLSENVPLVIVLEDLHWATRSTFELLHYLVRNLAGHPILLLGTCRLEAAGQRHPLRDWLQRLTRLGMATRIDLPRLPQTAIETWIAEMSGASAAIRPLAQRLYAETEGNPFFVVETIKALFEDGTLRMEGAGWQGSFDQASRAELPLPLGIRELIESRVQRLTPEAQAALRLAAVLGREFDFNLLSATWQQGEDQALAALDDLLRARLVLESAGGAVRDYAFGHHKIQEVVYTGLPRIRRQRTHARAAKALETLHGNQLDPWLSELAFHYEQGQRADPSLRAKAVEYLRLAGEQAAAQFANSEAIEYFQNALALAPKDDNASRYQLLQWLEKIHDLQGEREPQAAELAALVRLSESLPPRQQVEIALRQAHFSESTGNYPAAKDAAQSAIASSQAIQSPELEAFGCLQLGSALLKQGAFLQARGQFERARRLAQIARLSELEADALRQLGNTALRLGQYDSAADSFQQALQIFQQAGDSESQARVFSHLGDLAIDQNEYEQAIAYLDQALTIFRDIGYREGEATTLNSLGLLSANRGNYTESLSQYKQTLSICREIGDRHGEGLTLMDLGYVSWLRQDYSASKNYLEQALTICLSIGDRRTEGLTLLNLGYVDLCLAQYTDATNALEQGLKICREIGDRQKEGWGLSVQGYIADSLGDYAKAGEYFQQSLEIAVELGDRWAKSWRLTDLALVAHHSSDDRAAIEHSQGALLIAQELENRPVQAYAWLVLGHAMAGMGELTRARDAYQNAIRVKKEIDQVLPPLDALAGLARLALAQQDLARARAYANEIMAFLEGHSLDGVDDPFLVSFSCYRVLEALEDDRIKPVLERAYLLLQAQAEKIQDEALRRSFLRNVAVHREIVAAYGQQQA